MNLSNVIYLTQAQYDTLVGGGSITKEGVTYTYDENAVYCVEQGLPAVPTANGEYKLKVLNGVASWVQI